MHPALQERAPDIDLLTLLTVGMVVRCSQHRQAMAVLERRAGLAVFAQRRTAGVAGRAAVDSGRVGRPIADDRPRAFAGESPRLAPACLQRRQPLVVLRVIGRPRLPGPLDMGRCRAVTGFAGDVDLAPGGVIGLAGRIVALAQIGRMALGTLQCPVVVDAGPVQGVAMVDLLLWIEVEPALPAFALRPRIPGDRQHLVAPVGERNQVLLQRIDAKGVADFVVGQLAVRPVGAHHELVAAPEEGRLDAVLGEPAVVEVAENAGGGCLLHRQLVM
jgi:hypothetical protein